MKLSVLAARIDPDRELREKVLIDNSTEKPRVQLLGVDTDDGSLEALIDKFIDQGAGVALSDGK